MDAPCSASGVIRRHPDIKLLRRDADIAALCALQGQMLEALWPLLAPDGRDMVGTRVLQLQQAEQSFTLVDVEEEPVPSLLRGFSAPVKLEIDRSAEQLAFLFAHDPDPFNRWDAGQTLAIQVLLQLVDRVQHGQHLVVPADFIQAFRTTLSDPQLDPALIAQALTLPSESYLADQCETVDVDAIHTAREFVRKRLAEDLFDLFFELAQHSRVGSGDTRLNLPPGSGPQIDLLGIGFGIGVVGNDVLLNLFFQFGDDGVVIHLHDILGKGEFKFNAT